MRSEDFQHIKSGAILVSCSSKDIEFELSHLRANYKEETLFPNYTKYTNGNQHLYLLAKGHPVNFLDGSLESSPFSAVLALVQSEIILAVREIINLHAQNKKGLFELSIEDKRTLATMWLKHFCNQVTGCY